MGQVKYKRRDELELEIKELLTELDKYKNPYDYEIVKSNDVGNNTGYISGHAWIGRVRANTTYKIIVVEND